MALKKTQLKGAAKASVENKIIATADVEFDGGQNEIIEVDQVKAGRIIYWSTRCII